MEHNPEEFVEFNGAKVIRIDAFVLKNLYNAAGINLITTDLFQRNLFQTIPEKNYIMRLEDKKDYRSRRIEVFDVEIEDNKIKRLTIVCYNCPSLRDHQAFKFIRNLYYLEELNLCLELKEVPEWIQTLTNLRYLNLSGNLICNLPRLLLDLNKLEYLDIRNNNLNLEESDFKERLIDHPRYWSPNKRLITKLIERGVLVDF